jgi:hypothetical protein
MRPQTKDKPYISLCDVPSVFDKVELARIYGSVREFSSAEAILEACGKLLSQAKQNGAILEDHNLQFFITK